MGVLGERRIGEKWKEMEGRELCIWDIYSWGFEAWRPSRPLTQKYTPGGYVSQYVSHTPLSPVTPSIVFKIPQKIPKNT